ncbi:BREX-1 system phosphatase PglZ type A [Neobacillus niacini]|uniref:BREX-1 system phosphatase PglZ type A n=1 Tax=Neobacillus niacini TaxID=86668 RepID=UPI002FFEF044
MTHLNIIDMIKEKIRDEMKNKGRAIVFWYDPNEQVTIDDLVETLPEVQVRKLTDRNFFTIKLEIEIEKPNVSFLLYSNNPRPKYKNNFLLDILLYSSEFKSDESAILAESLGISDHILRDMMEKYPVFFRSKERKSLLGKVTPAKASEQELELSILAVLTGAKVPEIRLIVKNLLLNGLSSEKNELIVKINKFYSWERTLELIQQYFGLSIPNNQNTLQYLSDALNYQHLRQNIGWSMREWEENWSSTSPNICALFIEDWMNSFEDETSILEEYLKGWEIKYSIERVLRNHSVEEIEDIITVPVVDALIIEKCVLELEHDLIESEKWMERINTRLMSFWGRKSTISALYNVLYHAVRVTSLKNQLTFQVTTDVYDHYANEWYMVDQAYRNFMNWYLKVNHKDWLRDLPNRLTNWYENEFLIRLANETNQWLEHSWNTKVKKQTNFFQTYINNILEKETTKIFVIISDAFRYECAKELQERLNLHTNGKAVVEPMVASLPSYTKLGMASLLPHKVLTLRDNGSILADERPTDGLINRQKVLESKEPNSAIFHLSELLEWKRQQADEKLKGKRLVYLYHDVIDAIGDSRKTERDTYDAVEKAISELDNAVLRLSSLQAKRIFITADHGFLFQFKQIENYGKIESPLGNKFDGNRRFTVGNDMRASGGSIKLNHKQTPINQADVIIAKGINRFIGGGGLQFIHGGAMPQELVIPVIDYRKIEKGIPVDISVAVIDKMITNYRVSISFYQEQSVGDSYIPRSIKVAFYKDGERISNEIVLNFNLSGENKERSQTVTFNLVEKYYKLGDSCNLLIETLEGDKGSRYKEETFILRLYESLY